MKKRPYVVADKETLTYRIINAASKAQAIAHVVKGRYAAKAATVADIVAAVSATPPVNVEQAGEEETE